MSGGLVVHLGAGLRAAASLPRHALETSAPEAQSLLQALADDDEFSRGDAVQVWLTPAPASRAADAKSRRRG